jgi:AcrR family transcriptional regulator
VPTANPRLNRDTWIDAALALLLQSGPDAVAVQPIARQLGTTKGSFYWHFSSRDDLLRATLARWESGAGDDLIASVDARAGDAGKKAEALLEEVTAGERPGELMLLAGTNHPDVAAAVERVARKRIDYLARQLRSSGLTPAAAQRRALLIYTGYVGYAVLAASTPGVLPESARGRRALVSEMAELVLP